MSVSKTRIPVPKDKTVETYGHSGIERRRGSRDMTAGTIKIVAWLFLFSIILLSVGPPAFRALSVFAPRLWHLTKFFSPWAAFRNCLSVPDPHTIPPCLF